MKMTKTAKVLSLSAAVLLVVVVSIIVIRRRGRKVSSDGSPMSGEASLSQRVSALLGTKVYVNEDVRDRIINIWYGENLNQYTYFDNTLVYVIIPNNPTRFTYDSVNFVEIVAVGFTVAGKTTRKVLSEKAYIAEYQLNL